MSRCIFYFLPLDTDVQLLFHQQAEFQIHRCRQFYFILLLLQHSAFLNLPPLYEKTKSLARCETLTMQPARWHEALKTALFIVMTYLSWLSRLVAGLRLNLGEVEVHFLNTGLSTITLIRHFNYLTNDCILCSYFRAS